MLFPKLCYNEPCYKELGLQVNKNRKDGLASFFKNQLDTPIIKNFLDVDIASALGKIITKFLSLWSVKCSGNKVHASRVCQKQLLCKVS